MQQYSRTLRDFAAAQRVEAESTARLLRQTAQDSRMLKALTVMASLYLPASLLAVGYWHCLGPRDDANQYWE
jgi:hypothetical protein